ncbi:integral membrane protein pth11 [Fusarium sp. NRRL 52700]|nr:integral membrane protein pth11 [Fusarium sp. NRRL 52700]
MATTISKTSFAITLYRIATNAWMKYFLIFIIVTINVSMNLVWIFGFAKCTPLERVWNPDVPGTCWDKSKLLTFQLFAAYYSAILDFVLALLPWVILMRMTMRRRERLGVAVAMSLGAIAGITGIVKAVLVVSMKSEDITYDRVDLTIWTLTEPAASIMAICIPVLRMLYRELKSSSRSYNRNRTNTTPRDVDTRNTAGASNARQSKRYNPNSRYGRNSVVIMSGWQESQEHLQDDSDGSQSQTKISMSSGGVMKTEEVRVHHERLSTFSDENSIELRGLPPAQGKPGQKNAERAPSF